MLDQTSFINSVVTICCSYLSLVGSILVLLSYFIARSKSTPKAAYLILHLAASDFFWFLASATQSTYWLVGDGSVPTNLCYVCGPTVIFTRMASLLWTCAISFNVLMSVKKRKWSWKSQEKSWEWYRHRYYLIIFVLSFPGALLSMIKQHSSPNNSNLGCDPGYEKLGLWYEVFFSEVFPIVLGFSCNLYVYFQIRKKMSQSAFPQSVRKRRKRIMYHYIIVCILCWIPTIIFYFVELMGFHVAALEIVGRTSLYLSGFLNFLVFGMQDPHLKRSFVLVLHYMGLSLILPSSYFYSGPLKTTDVEKTVMFEEATISRNADLSKDKKNIYRYHKLSKDDKKALYAERPDLDPKSAAVSGHSRPFGALLASHLNSPADGKNRGKRVADATVISDDVSDCGSSSSSKHSLSVLSDLVDEGDVLNPLSHHLAEAGLLSCAEPGLVPRDSTELTLPVDDRNSLGLHVLSGNSSGSGAESSCSAVSLLESGLERQDSSSASIHGMRFADNSGGDAERRLLGGDTSDDSSDDESDEEDQELKAPVT